MSGIHEIVLAGSGGQGLVLMATFLGQACLAEGYNVVQTQSYGVSQRGGLIVTELLGSKEEILYQKVRTPSVVVALHPVVKQTYDNVKAPVLFDSSLVQKDLPGWYGIPCTSLALELGIPKAANLVALGGMLALYPFVKTSSVTDAIQERFKGEVGTINSKAVQVGYDLVMQQKAKA